MIRDRFAHEIHDEQYIERMIDIYCDAIGATRASILVPVSYQEQTERQTLIGMIVDKCEITEVAHYFQTTQERCRYCYGNLIEGRLKFFEL